MNGKTLRFQMNNDCKTFIVALVLYPVSVFFDDEIVEKKKYCSRKSSLFNYEHTYRHAR